MSGKIKKAKPWGLMLLIVLSCGLLSHGVYAQSAGGNAQMATLLESNNRKLAQAMERLNFIQQEFQSIKGQIDASQYLTKENDKVYQDLDSRVSTLEDKLDQIYNLLKELNAKQASNSGSSPPGNAMESAEYESFQGLLALVNARDYQAAASGFLGFLKKYPNSPYAPKAMFWVAECYYFLGDYAQAIKSFQAFTQKYVQDPRVKEAIYRQGLAFVRLKKYDEAKLFFKKVMANYPNTSEAAKAQTRLHRLEALEKGPSAMKSPSRVSSTGAGMTVPAAPPAKEKSTSPAKGSANQPMSKPSPYPKPEPQVRPNSAYDKTQTPLF